MKTVLKSIQTGWHFLFHPRETVDKLRDSSEAPRLAWFFLIFTVALWALVTGYVNLVLKETARGREKLLGVSMGPDILMTLLTVPLGILTVALAAFLVSRIARWLGGNSQFNYTFYTLAFTLCAGSFFFDLPHEIAWALTGAPWKMGECVPNWIYWTAFVMFAPIIWSLVVTVISLAHLYHLSLLRTLLSFLLGILPIFAVLIFLVM